MTPKQPSCKFLSLAFFLCTMIGCGGSNGPPGVDGGAVHNTSVGNMSVSYASRAVLSVSIVGSIGITGMAGGAFTRLTFNPVPVLNQSTIAYNDGGEVNAYSLLTATSALLTTGKPASDAAPTYSHDGRLVYYGSNGGRTSLISMNADGTSPVSIQPATQPLEIPAFSPVNSRVAYASQGVLNIMTPAGTGLVTGPTTFGGVQTLNLSAGGGTFTLTFKGQTTIPIAVSNSIRADMTSALGALSTIGGVGGSVTSGGTPNVFSLIFGGSLAGLNEPPITLNARGLTGVSVAEIVQTT